MNVQLAALNANNIKLLLPMICVCILVQVCAEEIAVAAAAWLEVYGYGVYLMKTHFLRLSIGAARRAPTIHPVHIHNSFVMMMVMDDCDGNL